MLRIGIFGYSGRMGRLIAQEIAASGKCALAGGLVREVKPEFKGPDGALITANADELIAVSDAVIDFAAAEMTPEFARIAAAHGKAFVSGTTGFGAEGQRALQRAAEKIPVLHATNTSLSLVVMKQLTAAAAKILGARGYDVSIVEEHHAQKKDAPSGTAKTLAEAVTQATGGKLRPHIESIREGEIVGEHDVLFAGGGESIRLHHSVTDRRIFARGAVEAALWLHGKPPGLYAMEDVLGIAR